MGLLSSLGLARASETASLQARVASLETRLLNQRRIGSGVDMTSGRFEYESNKALRGKERWATWEKMEHDPHVKGALRSQILPLLGAQWKIEPASDKPRDKRVAEFVAANLLREPSDEFGPEYWVQTSWAAQRLPEILDMLQSGFSMFARDDHIVTGLRCFKRLHWLEPDTVDPMGWKLSDDFDAFETIHRTYKLPSNTYVYRQPLDLDSLSLYVWDLKGARFEGRPYIRSMYGAWHRKEFVQTQQAIWAQRVGAPIPYGFSPPGWDSETNERWKEFVESTRGTAPDIGYGTFPMGTDRDGKAVSGEIKYAGAEHGEVDRMRGIVEMENAEIAHAGGTKSGLLGETQTGSRAVADPMSRMEMQQVQAVATVVSEWETHGVANLTGNIHQLVAWNFAGVKDYPRLTVGKISPTEGREGIEAFIAGKAAGLVPSHPELMRQFTERYGFNLPDDAYKIQEPPDKQQPPPVGEPPPADEATDTGEPDTGGEAAPVRAAHLAMGREQIKRRIASLMIPEEGSVPKGYLRRPNGLERQHVNLAAIADSYRTGERDALTALRAARRGMIEDILARLRSGKLTRRNVESQSRSRYRGQAKAVAAVKEQLMETAAEGRTHVKAELTSMGAH